jgi:energy-coupling factor transport system permease protein
MRQGWIPISILLLFTFVGNLIFSYGKVLFEFGPLTVTDAALDNALIRSSRLSGLIVGAKLLTLTTPIENILKALRRLLVPLERVGVSTKDFFDTASLSLQLIPRIRDEAMKRLREVKADSNEKGILKRLQMVLSLLLPLMIKTIQMPADVFSPKNKTGETASSEPSEGGPLGHK